MPLQYRVAHMHACWHNYPNHIIHKESKRYIGWIRSASGMQSCLLPTVKLGMIRDQLQQRGGNPRFQWQTWLAVTNRTPAQLQIHSTNNTEKVGFNMQAITEPSSIHSAICVSQPTYARSLIAGQFITWLQYGAWSLRQDDPDSCELF